MSTRGNGWRFVKWTQSAAMTFTLVLALVRHEWNLAIWVAIAAGWFYLYATLYRDSLRRHLTARQTIQSFIFLPTSIVEERLREHRYLALNQGGNTGCRGCTWFSPFRGEVGRRNHEAHVASVVVAEWEATP